MSYPIRYFSSTIKLLICKMPTHQMLPIKIQTMNTDTALDSYKQNWTSIRSIHAEY